MFNGRIRRLRLGLSTRGFGMTRPLWEIEKDTVHGGASYRLSVGIPGVPGTRQVSGLSQHQAQSLERALVLLEERVTNRALKNVREALGITHN